MPAYYPYQFGSVARTAVLVGVLFIAAQMRQPRAEDYLGEIVVTARQPVITGISNISELDREFIERRSDRSLEEALEIIPNLNVRAGGQGVPRIDIRGLRTRHIKFLVNGIPFNSTLDGQFDPTFIPASQIDRVKVTTGGASELYGAGAMGVIDVLTRSTRQDQLQINAELGANDHRHIAAQGGGGAGEIDYYANFTHRNRDSYELSDDFVPTAYEDGGARLNSDLERNTGFGGLTYQAGEHLQLGLTGSFLLGAYGVPPTTLNDAYASRPTYERVEDQTGYTLQGSFNYDPGSEWFGRGWIYLNDLEQDENRYDDAGFNSIDDNTLSGSYMTATDSHRNGLGLQVGFRFNGRSRLSAALDVYNDDWNQTGVIRDVAVTTSGGGGSGGGGGGLVMTTYKLRPLDEHGEITAYSLSAEYEITIGDRLDLVIGGGHHWQNPDQLNNDSTGSYLLGLNYRPLDQLSLHGSWSRKVRMPSIRNLFDADRGNPALEPEVLQGVDAGVNVAFSAWGAAIGVTGFYYNIDDFIQRDRVTDLFRNIEESRVHGVEFSLKLRPLERLIARFSFSLQDSEDETRSGMDELTNTPGRIASVDLDYALHYGVSAHLKFLHVADNVYYTRNPPFLQGALVAANRLDLRLRWQPAASRYSTYVGVDNLFDAYFEDEYALPAPGRTLFGGVSWRR
jgi:outer membrane cobalamin receptor